MPPDSAVEKYAEEARLASDCARGDRGALERFEQGYLSQVPNFIAHISRNSAFVDEVIQRLRARLLVARPDAPCRIADYKARGPLGGWLRVVAVRVALDLKQESETPSADPDAQAVPRDIELDLVRRIDGVSFKEAITHALGSLASEERVILRLRYVDGLSVEKIGVIYSVHAATIVRRLAASRERVVLRVHEYLRARRKIKAHDVESLAALLQSQIDLSLSRVLGDMPSSRLADCLESNGQTASAWREFVDVAAIAEARADSRASVAKERARALFPRLSKIVVDVARVNSDSLDLECDGEHVPATRYASGIYVDPGTHHLRASLAGKPFWEADVSVGPSADVQTLIVPSATGTLAANVTALSAPLTADRPSVAPSKNVGSRRLEIAGITAGGMGLVSMGLGIYFGLAAVHDRNQAEPGCGNMFCSSAAHNLQQDAIANATAADVSFGVGAAAIVTGVLLYVFGKRSAVPSVAVKNREVQVGLAF